MKTLLLSGLLALCLVVVGCMTLTPTQQLALANTAAGQAFAINALQHDPAALPALQRMATDLPLIPQGKVSDYEMGQMTALLQQAKINVVPGDTKTQQQIAALINLMGQAQAEASGGSLTVDQAIVLADLQNVALGITKGIAFYQGTQNPNSAPPTS